MSYLDKIDNEYLKQAKDFLESTKTSLTVVVLGKLIPEWDDKGNPRKTLSVTLKNERHEYNFKFYCSLNDTEWNKPRKYQTVYQSHIAESKWKKKQFFKEFHYDILACLNVDHSEDFEDFCDNYGYSEDSIKARDTYLSVRKETKNLKRLFTSEQLELLSEIS